MEDNKEIPVINLTGNGLKTNYTLYLKFLRINFIMYLSNPGKTATTSVSSDVNKN